MSGKRRFGLSLVSTTLVLAGCPNTNILPPPKVEDADDQQATCQVAKDPNNPLIVEWPGTSKVDLDSASQNGIVVVSYKGCTLKVLSGCQAGGNYGFTLVTPTRDKLSIANQNDLYAKLPLGAASLKAELALGSSLELDYVAVGQRIASESPKELTGECAGASHYVRSIMIGAYSLDARAAGKVGGGVEVGAAGVGAGREESVRKLKGSGNIETCTTDPQTQDCRAVLQLGLAPLAVTKSGNVANQGFGQGLGSLSEVPKVTELGDISDIGAGGLASVDVDYLTVVQNAMTLDKDKSRSAQDKMNAWIAVRDKRSDGSFLETAKLRANEWNDVMLAEQRRKEQLEQLRTRYNADKTKLDALLQLDDNLISQEKKELLKREFATIYEPYQDDLKEIETPVVASTPTGGTGDDSGVGVGHAVVGLEYVWTKFDIGGHAQGFAMTDDNDIVRGNYDLTGLYLGGQLGVNVMRDPESALGIFGYGHYFMNGTYGQTEEDYTGGATIYRVGGGLRFAGNMEESLGMNFGVMGGVIVADTDKTFAACNADRSALGGGGDIFLGMDLYPLNFLSAGVTAYLGVASMSSEGCDVDVTTGAQQVVDVSVLGVGVSAAGHVGAHF